MPHRVGALTVIHGDSNLSGDCHEELLTHDSIIGKARIGAHEYAIPEPHAVPQLHTVLHSDGIPNRYIVLDEDAVADIAIAPYSAPGNTWANAQIRVPFPSLVVSQMPCGWTKKLVTKAPR